MFARILDLRLARAWCLRGLVLLAGCGRVGFATVAGDASDCWSSWTSGSPRFTTEPVAVAGINTKAREKNPFVTADRTTLYFASDRAGGMGGTDFWRAVRASPDEPFGTPAPVPGLNSDADDGRVELVDDGLTAVLSSLRPPNLGGYDLWLATRSDLTAEFVVTQLSAVNSKTDDKDPHFSSDGAHLYFSVGSMSLSVAERSGATFGARTPLPGLDDVPGGGDPNVSPDELAIVFSSQPQPQSAIDLYVATRASTSDPFGTPAPLTAINTEYTEQDAFVTRDGCELWFASDRSNNVDIYVATVAP